MSGHERISAEHGLRRGETRFRAAIDAVDGILWTNDAAGRMVGEQPGWARLTGQSEADYQGYGWARAVHPDDAEPTLAAWNAAVAERRQFVFEHRLRRADGAWRIFAIRAVPVFAPDGAIEEWVGVHTDVTDRRLAEAALREERDRMRSYLEVADVMLLALDRTGRIQAINRRGAEILGFEARARLIGRDWFTLASPEAARAETRALFLDYIAGGKADGSTHEGVIRRRDGAERRIAWRNSVLRDDRGQVIGTLSSGDDVTEQREAQARERLLAQEVDHRAKNLLAVVQSVVQLTRGRDVAAFKQAVIGRIQSLARTHGLLAAGRWEGADLRQLIEDELAPYSGGGAARFQIDGPALRLKPAAAQALALVIHELATNAAKYGAFSCENGKLYVKFCCFRDVLELFWREIDGPAVVPPRHKGFGSVVLTSSVERQLRGTVNLDWQPQGLSCTLTLPLDDVRTGAPADRVAPPSAAVPAPPASPTPKRGARILIVEDEALIAAEMERVLAAAGHVPLPPAARVAEAFDRIYDGAPQLALLDINLAGARSFPIAAVLQAKNIPFAFCSGYGEAALVPDDLSAAPMLAKPLDPAALLALVGRLLPA